MYVSKWMTRKPFVVQQDDLLQVVTDAMQRGCFRHAPVVTCDGGVIGMVSDRDIREQKGYLSSTRVSAALTEPAITVRPEDSIEQAARIMLDRQIRALPVVDAEQRLVGIITTTDLLRAFVDFVGHAGPLPNKAANHGRSPRARARRGADPTPTE
jgi:acetoin utilization protein AcuB